MLFQDSVINSACDIRSFLSASFYDEPVSTEEMLASTSSPDNTEAINRIASHVSNQPIDQTSKMLIVKNKFCSLVESNPVKTFMSCTNL